ncbi:hypothetical protein lerEdw1_002179 [Lerista edwardsae]|nr:hypothetical protein lerEdw1_002179 [Lerista edwardsae]
MSDYSAGGPPPPSAGPPGAGGGAGATGPSNQAGGGGAGGAGQAGGAAGPPGGIRKDAFADAVQRARQIAAKIGGDSATTVNNTTPDFGFGGQKRQLEDGAMPPPPQLGPIHPPPRKAKMMLDDIVSRGRGGPPGQFHDNANGQNGTVQEIMIPAGKAGLVIGKGGETIKQLQDGSQNTNVDKPLRIIGDPYKVQVPVPRHSVGVVIGRSGEMIKKIQNDAGVRIQFKQGGENVKAINQQTGAFVEISRQLPPNGDPNFKLFIIRGSPQQIDHAKQLIEEKIEVAIRFPPPTDLSAQLDQDLGQGDLLDQRQWVPSIQGLSIKGPPVHPLSQQPQQPGAPPQQDYTKAWEEYYKKQAQVATGAGPAAPPGPQPDYSAAWAEYYRQQAAYYGQTPGAGGPVPPPTQQGQQVVGEDRLTQRIMGLKPMPDYSLVVINPSTHLASDQQPLDHCLCGAVKHYHDIG